MKIAVALGFAIIFGAFGDILLSIGMKRTGGVAIRRPWDVLYAVKQAFSSRFILLGVCSMALYFGSYIAALAWVDVSVANPMTALSYLIAGIYAIAFLKEGVSLQRWLGIALVIAGATLVGVSS